MSIKTTKLPTKASEYLQQRHISKDVIKKMQIEWTENYSGCSWICIPVFDANGIRLSTKFRRPPDSNAKQKTLFEKGTMASLYGIQNVEDNSEPIVISEGELDAMCLLSHNIIAVCSTAGAQTFRGAWLADIPQDAEVWLCFDLDPAGVKGESKVEQILREVRPDITIKKVKLPSHLGEGGDVIDFADYCKKQNLDFADEFKKLVKPVVFSETPRGYEDRTITLDEVLEKTRAIGLVNDYVVEVVLATYISKELEDRNPIWLMLVGNPSSNKTVLVNLVKGATDSFMLDTMTSNPFISGMHKKDKPQDLLPILNGKCFIVKDYTTFFGRSEETVKQLLSDLVSIYDGEYSKHSGARGTVRYSASFSHLGCVTPMGLKMRQQYMNMVGARFLSIQVPQLTDEEREQSFGIAWSPELREKVNAASECATTLVNSIVSTIAKDGVHLDEESKDIQLQLNRIAELTAKARGEVRMQSRKFIDEDNIEKSYQEVEDLQVEEPFRALHQFKALSRSLAIVRGKSEITAEEIKTVRLVALSSMPVKRAETLSAFEKFDELSPKEAADLLDKNYSSVRRHLEELRHLGVLERTKGEDGKTWRYKPVAKFKSLIHSEDML